MNADQIRSMQWTGYLDPRVCIADLGISDSELDDTCIPDSLSTCSGFLVRVEPFDRFHLTKGIWSRSGHRQRTSPPRYRNLDEECRDSAGAAMVSLKRRDPEHHAHEPSSFEFADSFPGPATAYVTAPPLSPRPRRTRRRAAQGFAEVVLRERTEHLQAQAQYQAS